jgi:nucleotide-binding universal stress UspA family protein
MIRFPPKTILVAYDPSDDSRTAWRHAVEFAAACGAALEAVYVAPWQRGDDLMPQPDLTPVQAARLRDKIRAAIGEGTKITILQGDPAASILSCAKRHGAELIVVGTHGRTGLKRALLGSVAEAVIRGAAVPVLAARGRPRAIGSILAPVNFTSYSDYGFAYAAAASAALSARLTILHVTDDPIWDGNPEFRISGLLHHLPDEIRRKCRATMASAVGGAVKGILKMKKDHDWIVLIAHEKSLIKDMFFGTTLEQVLRRSSVPVLSVPAPKMDLSHAGHRQPRRAFVY